MSYNYIYIIIELEDSGIDQLSRRRSNELCRDAARCGVYIGLCGNLKPNKFYVELKENASRALRFARPLVLKISTKGFFMFLHIEKTLENVRLFIEGAWYAITMFLNIFQLLFSCLIFCSEKKIGVFSLIVTTLVIIIPFLPAILGNSNCWYIIADTISFTRWLLIIAIVNAIAALLTPSGMPSENLEIIHRIAQAISLVSCAMLRCKLFDIRFNEDLPETFEEICVYVLSLLLILSFATLLVIHFGNGMFI